MNAFEKLQKEINNIKEYNQDAGNELHEQLHTAANSEWTREDLSDLILQDNDVADKYYDDEEHQHQEIREIQHEIINSFGDDQ